MRKDYCSGFPEQIGGVEIGQTCCRQHDNEVGQAGTYNPITPHTNFFQCLRKRGVSLFMSCIITLGGAVFTWYKQPWLWYKKYKWRHRPDWDGVIKG